MSEVIQFRASVVGDGAKIDARDILSSIIAPEAAQALAVVYVDKDGELMCASTDGRAETLMLFERAKSKFILGYED